VCFLKNVIAPPLATCNHSGYATLNVNMSERKRGKTYHFSPEWEKDNLAPVMDDLPWNRQLFLDQLICACLFSCTWKSLSTDPQWLIASLQPPFALWPAATFLSPGYEKLASSHCQNSH